VMDEPDPNQIVLGQIWYLIFSGHNTLARTQEQPTPVASALPTSPGLGFTCHGGGLIDELSGYIRVAVNADGPWHRGSYVRLEVTQPSLHGFSTGASFVDDQGRTGYFVEGTEYFGTAGFTEPGQARAYDSDGYLITPSGARLAKVAYLEFAEDSLSMSQLEIGIKSTVAQEACVDPSSVELMASVAVASNPPAVVGDGPYVNTIDFCDPFFIETGALMFKMGDFAPYFLGLLPQWSTGVTVLDFAEMVNLVQVQP